MDDEPFWAEVNRLVERAREPLQTVRAFLRNNGYLMEIHTDKDGTITVDAVKIGEVHGSEQVKSYN